MREPFQTCRANSEMGRCLLSLSFPSSQESTCLNTGILRQTVLKQHKSFARIKKRLGDLSAGVRRSMREVKRVSQERKAHSGIVWVTRNSSYFSPFSSVTLSHSLTFLAGFLPSLLPSSLLSPRSVITGKICSSYCVARFWRFLRLSGVEEHVMKLRNRRESLNIQPTFEAKTTCRMIFGVIFNSLLNHHSDTKQHAS